MWPYEVEYRHEKSVKITKAPEDLPYPKITENAQILLERRYAKKIVGEAVEIIEDPRQIYWRVAEFISYGSRKWLTDDKERQQLAREYYSLMANGYFLPNTPTLANAGRENNAQLAACFVLPIEDSMESIFETLKRAALIHKTGGGTGFSFTRLRPKDSFVKGTHGTASGPVSFMKMYNWVTEVVKQGGMRRGANMGILRVDHPEILEFIECKSGEINPLENFNISVAITDKFMQALEANADYELINPQNGEMAGCLKAKEVWEKITASAWLCGDPGLFFIDRANNSTANPIKSWQIYSTNPCGEQPIYDNDACNLGSIRLSAFYLPRNDKDWNLAINWEEFRRVIHLSVQFLDDVVTMSTYPLPEIESLVDSLRRIGLGPMGLADLLQLLLIPYDSKKAMDVNMAIARFMKAEAISASRRLAEIRGHFPLFKKSIFAGEINRRNANVSTVAPTGSLSRLTDCEGGIEPPFSLSYFHSFQKLQFTNNTVKSVLQRLGFWNEKVEKTIVETGSLKDVKDLPADVRDVFKTALEIDPEIHVKVAAIWQNHYSESGVSKTINLPETATIEDVKKIYWQAYEGGCKGITVFRFNCRRAGMMTIAEGAVKKDKEERPFQLEGCTYKVKTPYGNAYFTVNAENGRLFEGFLSIGKAGNEVLELTEWAMRLFSLIGRMPSSWSLEKRMQEIIEQSQGIGGKKGLGPDDEGLVRAVPDGIAYCCRLFLERLREEGIEAPEIKDFVSGNFCPYCQKSLIVSEGCRGGKCFQCGYAAC